MSDTTKQNYDTSIGSDERSARSATKFYAVILGIVFLIGLILLAVLYSSLGTGTNTMTPGGRTDSSSQSPGP
jgi:hypothetical protein